VSAPVFAAIGDSFTAGQDPEVRPWPEDVAGWLPSWQLVNLAEAGASSDVVVANQLEPAISLRPALVSVICGANDVLLTTRPDVGAFATNFSKILAKLRRELPQTRVVTVTYPDVVQFMPLRPRSRARVENGLRELNDAIGWLARRYDAACLDFAGHPERGERENFAEDGFHPSDVGHRKAARAFALGLRDHFGIELEETA
jgi:lysophospholipase L1-like esterase